MLINLIYTAIGLGAFSFFLVHKFTKSDTPVTGWLITRLRWLMYSMNDRRCSDQPTLISKTLQKLIFLISECEYCFAAQLSLWIGIFYLDTDWVQLLCFVGISMTFTAVTSHISKSQL